jgi:hypothetical protein
LGDAFPRFQLFDQETKRSRIGRGAGHRLILSAALEASHALIVPGLWNPASNRIRTVLPLHCRGSPARLTRTRHTGHENHSPFPASQAWFVLSEPPVISTSKPAFSRPLTLAGHMAGRLR